MRHGQGRCIALPEITAAASPRPRDREPQRAQGTADAGGLRAPLLRRSALRRVRHPLPRPGAQPLLVQLAARRVRHVPRLRPRDGHRLRARRPRRLALAQGRRDPPLAEQELPRGAARSSLDSRAGAASASTSPGTSSPTRSAPGSSRAKATGRRRVVRGEALLRLAREPQLQDARPRAALALPRLPRVPRLRRRAAEAGGAALADRARRRAQRPRDDEAADRRARSLLRIARASRQPRRGGGDGHRGDPPPARLPHRGRARLPRPRPAVAHALRRRGAAREPHDRARDVAGERALRARRAEHRAAPARRGPARRRAPPAARLG